VSAGADAKYNNSDWLKQLYMNFICESGRRYDILRHIKRTSKYFSPKEIFFDSAADKEENVFQENEADESDILLEGYRQPDDLYKYLSTNSKAGM